MKGIVQARMSSRRLPGKVLMPTADGRPLLERVLERAAKSLLVKSWGVATSDHPSDDAIAEHCARTGVPVFRGDLEDVAGRFLAACDFWKETSFVRISADSPWMDARLIDACADAFGTGADVATNVFPRTFPKGVSVEVVRRAALERARSRMTLPEEREHVTGYFYARPEDFAVRSVRNPDGDWSAVNLCVDTEEDWKTYLRIDRELGADGLRLGWKGMCDAYRAAGGVR